MVNPGSVRSSGSMTWVSISEYLNLHEVAHVRPRLPGEQRLASGRRTVMDEIVERGVVGQERHRFMDEVQNGDADRLSHRVSSDRVSSGRWRRFWWFRPGAAGSAHAVEAEGTAGEHLVLRLGGQPPEPLAEHLRR